ncbi:MAG: hypothetical protein H6741_07295 [Alphaproteobacteria bacterium]|nr:hypothetical protein [Alphaproteobacteria bacterium]
MSTSRRELLSGFASLGLAACHPGLGADRAELGLPLELKPPPPGFQAGMGLAHIHREGRGYGSARSREQLRALRALGVTHVALTPFAYMPDPESAELRFGGAMDRSLTDEHLRAEARAAREEGLAVCIKPHVWSWAFMRGRSRQDIEPAEGWGPWFEAYGDFAEHYAALAEEVDAALYVVGLEYLKATEQNPGAWGQVARRCRGRYGGALTYAANWWREVEVFADWSDFDLVGVNAYFPLAAGAAPDARALCAAWRPHLRTLEGVARAAGKDVVVTELGVKSVAGAYEKPWDSGLSGPADPAMQARFYEAALYELHGQPWVKGLYWWKWFTDPGGEQDLYVPEAPAQEVLRRWWV